MRSTPLPKSHTSWHLSQTSRCIASACPPSGNTEMNAQYSWYEFRAYNAQRLYGYGTQEEAYQYADRLNREREVCHFVPYQLSEEQATKLGPADDAFNLEDALEQTEDH
jgi:hypothetical protein